MKYCKRCDQTLPYEMFTKATKRYDGLQAYCAACMKEYRKEHYRANKKDYFNRARELEARLRELVLEYKGHDCSDCKQSFPGEPWLIELDHRDGSDKVKEISFLVKNGNKKALQEELLKCDPVCANCHRRRTAKRGGWIDNRWGYMLTF